MKKAAITILVLLLTLFAFPLAAGAEEADSAYDEITASIDKGIRADTGGDADDFLDEHDITLSEPESVAGVSVTDFFSEILSAFASAVTKPLALLGKLIAISLVCTLARSLAPQSGAVTQTFRVTGVLTCVLVLYNDLTGSFSVVVTALSDMNKFMISYVPVFASVTAAGGTPSSAAGYYATVLSLCEIIALVTNRFVLPFLGLLTAFSIVEAMGGLFSFSGLTESVKKISTWVLGIVMTVFVGMISIQSIVGTSADSVGIRAAKFAASSFIPVVGSSVSEAYTTVRGSLGVIRSGTGSIGIIVLLITVLRPIAAVVCMKLAVELAAMVNGMLGESRITALLRSIGAVLSVALSAIICFALIFIVATAVVMMSALNV
ncbi:MAG: hypothetical protein QM689_02905 [Oscillospiraceae bacterium]